jgi:hypothetical protein
VADHLEPVGEPFLVEAGILEDPVGELAQHRRRPLDVRGRRPGEVGAGAPGELAGAGKGVHRVVLDEVHEAEAVVERLLARVHVPPGLHVADAEENFLRHPPAGGGPIEVPADRRGATDRSFRSAAGREEEGGDEEGGRAHGWRRR